MFSSFFEKSRAGRSNGRDESGNCPFLEDVEGKKHEKPTNSSSSRPTMPKGHEKYSESEKDKCPYQQMQPNIEGKEGVKPKKEKMPKGGCPFMPSEKKKNPSLDCATEGWNEEFISAHSYQIDYRGFLSFSFDQLEKPNFNLREKRKVFDTYPVYLKHTLFMNDKNMKKVRELEVAQRFFVFDKMREKGNKEFHKANYSESILYYEQALSCFKWLEHVEKDDEGEENEQKPPATSETTDEKEEAKDSHEIEIQDSEIEPEGETEDPFLKNLPKETPEEKAERLAMLEKLKAEKKEFKKKYKGLMTTYTDDNVVLHDGEDLTDSQDIEMRQSMLMTIYMSLAVSYMKNFHFKMAQLALEDAFKITQKSSQILFRKSQAVSHDRFSDLQELEQAKKDIEKAIEMKHYEKIFQQEQGILRIMNLSNHAEAYLDQAHYTVKRIKQRTEFETEQISMIFKREKHIQEVEQRLISEGKIPRDSEEENTSFIDMKEEQQEYEIILEMMRKYYRVIEFYTETKKPEQVRMARSELQTLSETVYLMNFLVRLDFNSWVSNPIMKILVEENGLDLTNEKTLRRLDRLRKDRVKNIFENGNYNFEMFQYALKDYFKRKEEAREQAEKDEAEKAAENQPPAKLTTTRKILNSFLSCEFFLQITLVAAIFAFFVYFNSKGTVPFSEIFFTPSNEKKI